MKNFNNIDERVVDDLKKEIKSQGKLKIAAASLNDFELIDFLVVRSE